MRTVTAIHTAVSEPIGDLITYRAMPTQAVPIDAIEPFILLNHHGWQQYAPHNNGLPFGPHPHRGFQTVTFILQGDLTHKDSSGAASIIGEGGVQWMVAGSGLVHAEVSSEEFKAKGGPLEILQLWINLPARLKMMHPAYTGLQRHEIPTISYHDGKVVAHIISGRWGSLQGPVHTPTDIHLSYATFTKGGEWRLSVPADQNIFCYIVKGEVIVNGSVAHMHNLVQFGHDSEEVMMIATDDALILFGYAAPFKEPIVPYGPFVMNSEEEIRQAFADYRAGKFGDEHALID